jgi:hypothetical protein
MVSHLDVAGALSGAGEWRQRLGDAARVLQDVDDRGQVALVAQDPEGQGRDDDGSESHPGANPVEDATHGDQIGRFFACWATVF